VDLRACLDDLEKRKFLTLPELELRPLVRPFLYTVHVSNVLVLTVHCKLINFIFQIFILFISEMLADFMSYIVQIIPNYAAWIL
jgi:hypothetical protein